jgi:hypothetical protein
MIGDHPIVSASTMIAQVMGCAQGQMSQWGCGKLWPVDSGEDRRQSAEPADA